MACAMSIGIQDTKCYGYQEVSLPGGYKDRSEMP